MSFLTPWAAVLAASVAIPSLVVLYFLKLRRRPRRVASTLLWDKSIEDLQVNVPFQRLKLSILFLLQLLVLLLLVAALGRPVVEADGPPGSRLILLIDRSASMKARLSAGTTRFDRALELAEALIEQTSRGRTSRETMIISFASGARVVSGFETDRRRLQEALRSIAPTDEPANLEAALDLADAFSSTTDEAAEGAPTIVLISDGGVLPPSDTVSGFRARAGAFEFVPIEGDVENVGIVALDARRVLDDPTQVDLFARIANSGSQVFEGVATVRVDGEVVSVRRLEVPAASEDGLGAQPQSWQIDLPGGGLLTVALSGADALAADDVASIVIPPPGAPVIAVIAPNARPDRFVRELAEVVDAKDLSILTPAQLGAEKQRAGGAVPFDFLIFDRATPEDGLDAPWIAFGAAPSGVTAERPGGGRRFAWWDRRHPLLRHVELDGVVFAEFESFTIPLELEDAMTVLARSSAGPVIVSVGERNRPQVVVGFELIKSNWPADVSLLVFFQNLLDRAHIGIAAARGVAHRTGEIVTVPVAGDAETIELSGVLESTIQVDERDRVSLPAVTRAGILNLTGVEPGYERLAFSLLSETETDLRHRSDLTVETDAVGPRSMEESAMMDLWPWLVAGAFIVLTLEWLVYTRRARV